MLLSPMQAKLYWITAAPQGRLAIMPRPRAGEWLADELASLKSSGIDVVASLLTDDEVAELDLHHEPKLCREIGLTFVSHPIVDRNVPKSSDDFLAFTDQIQAYLSDDGGVAVHCRMGIGRSSLVASCLLMKSGFSVANAFASISRDRGMDVPDTQAQIEWVHALADRLQNGRNAT